jgi:hypothetical protein
VKLTESAVRPTEASSVIVHAIITILVTSEALTYWTMASSLSRTAVTLIWSVRLLTWPLTLFTLNCRSPNPRCNESFTSRSFARSRPLSSFNSAKFAVDCGNRTVVGRQAALGDLSVVVVVTGAGRGSRRRITCDSGTGVVEDATDVVVGTGVVDVVVGTDVVVVVGGTVDVDVVVVGVVVVGVSTSVVVDGTVMTTESAVVSLSVGVSVANTDGTVARSKTISSAGVGELPIVCSETCSPPVYSS